MADIAPEDVRLLWSATSNHEEAARTAATAREALDSTLLQVARRSKVGLSELSAVTGLHPNTVRAGIQRAAGEAAINFEQPELDLASLGESAGVDDELRAVQARRAIGNPTAAAAAVSSAPSSSAGAVTPTAAASPESVVETEAER